MSSKNLSASPLSVRPEPPEEQFWEKYSGNSEFPLATLGSGAAHIALVLLFIYIIGMESDRTSKVSPPIRALVVGEGGMGEGDGSVGSGGGDPREAANPTRDPSDPVPPIPDAEFREVSPTIVEWAPDLKDNPDMIKAIAQSPEFDKLKKMNDDLRKKLLEGVNGSKGKGSNSGTGNTGDEGSGSTGKGTGNSTGERTLRWTLKFDTNSGQDYLDQLTAMQAKIIMPQPPGWRSANLIKDLTKPNNGESIDVSSIREMHFIDDRNESVLSVSEALGLKFRPPYFIAVFPKDIEDQLAAREAAYRNRDPKTVASTTFRIIVRDGKPTITVVEQRVKAN